MSEQEEAPQQPNEPRRSWLARHHRALTGAAALAGAGSLVVGGAMCHKDNPAMVQKGDVDAYKAFMEDQDIQTKLYKHVTDDPTIFTTPKDELLTKIKLALDDFVPMPLPSPFDAEKEIRNDHDTTPAEKRKQQVTARANATLQRMEFDLRNPANADIAEDIKDITLDALLKRVHQHNIELEGDTVKSENNYLAKLIDEHDVPATLEYVKVKLRQYSEGIHTQRNITEDDKRDLRMLAGKLIERDLEKAATLPPPEKAEKQEGMGRSDR